MPLQLLPGRGAHHRNRDRRLRASSSPGWATFRRSFPEQVGVYLASYTQEPGFCDTLTFTGATSIRTQTGCALDWLMQNGDGYICDADAGTYGPAFYVYTDPYGRVYTISATGGLQSIKDLAGNTLTVTPTGISSTNGLSVPFVRNSSGRITQITDTLGNVYHYSYDANGNLASVAYPGLRNPATYSHDPTHNNTGGNRSARQCVAIDDLRFERPASEHHRCTWRDDRLCL
ncbi:MAG TPA: hypothetical protein VK789_27760 [Bryobacteraceae bacterium]|nr:hypothetical protein [Bryobacteraceae bacterium]